MLCLCSQFRAHRAFFGLAFLACVCADVRARFWWLETVDEHVQKIPRPHSTASASTILFIFIVGSSSRGRFFRVSILSTHRQNRWLCCNLPNYPLNIFQMFVIYWRLKKIPCSPCANVHSWGYVDCRTGNRRQEGRERERETEETGKKCKWLRSTKGRGREGENERVRGRDICATETIHFVQFTVARLGGGMETPLLRQIVIKK